MSEFNPYAPPKSQIIEANTTNLKREGKKILFVPVGADLPPRCIKCNAPVEGHIKQRKLYWHTPYLYLLILFNLLVYALVALFARKKVTLSVGLCDMHRKQRNKNIFIWLGSFFVSLVFLVVFISQDMGENLVMFAILAIIITLFAAAFSSRLVRATKIDDTGTRIHGCGEDFLQSFED